MSEIDIVERLLADELPNDGQWEKEARMVLCSLLAEAADEIERLRQALRHYVCYCVLPNCEVASLDRDICICGLTARKALEEKEQAAIDDITHTRDF